MPKRGSLLFLRPIVSLPEFLAADENPATFPLSHPKHLPLFSSPLEDHSSRHGSHHHQVHDPPKAPYESVQTTDGDYTPPSSKHEAHDTHDPPLKAARKSSKILLFYDLFFVANLTTFTTIHEINDGATFKSYLGFFAILWFTWLQVALFDVRFSNDSAWERLCKALQFGVMVGFAVVGPGYNTGDGNRGKPFRTLSWILMISRLILAGQYLVAAYWLKAYKKAWLPMLAHITTMIGTAAIFLGVGFTFSDHSYQGITGWYITLGAEAFVILGVSGSTRFLSFRRTSLVERLGLLTLIILGEGIIGLCSAIRRVSIDGSFSSDVIGLIICAVLIIYFIWMLYFDQIETERVGTIRQPIWTILHFGYHGSVLFVVEGLNQLAVWRKVYDVVLKFYDDFYSTYGANTTDINTEALNETVKKIYERFNESQWITPDITSFFDILKDSHHTNASDDAAYNVTSAVATWIFESFDVQVPKEAEYLDQNEQAQALYSHFFTVFLYFFIAAGTLLIFLAALFWLSKRRKSRGEWLSIALRALVGVGLTLITIIYAPMNQTDGNMRYFTSAWMLPTVLFAYGMVVLLDTILVAFVRKAIHRKSLVKHMALGSGDIA